MAQSLAIIPPIVSHSEVFVFVRRRMNRTVDLFFYLVVQLPHFKCFDEPVRVGASVLASGR